MTLALLLAMVPSTAVAIDPQPVPSDAPSGVPPTRPSGLVFEAPDTQEPGDFAVPNFQQDIVWSGLDWPMVVAFAADGRVFVAEKSGIIKAFDSLDDPTPTQWADLRTAVHNYWDRGLLGMALDPDFTTNDRIYVAYTYDAPIGGTAPTWGLPDTTDDGCPTPPGAMGNGCVVSARLSVLVSGTETVLINDWCQQFPSHSIGDIKIDDAGALIVSGGDGASFVYTDYGQTGNPCGDPPGGTMTLPAAEGGALRSQDIRTSADPTGLAGTVIRVNRFTGAPMPDNPVTTGSVNERRIIAHGLRNPFRTALHPVSGELWIGDVGWTAWEEIDRHGDPTGPVRNFGWPCREGASDVPGTYGGASLCDSMTTWQAPVFAWPHSAETTPGDGCGSSSSSVSGLAFYPGGPYPDIYDNALFFTDYSRQCLWVMRAGADGLPDPALPSFFGDVGNPVYLTTGPGGDLFYVNLIGSVLRIRFLFDNDQPSAALEADPTDGSFPLSVSFDASGSTDPNTDPLTYAWDFGDNNGMFDDSLVAAPEHTYDEPGSYIARVRVSDGRGGTDVATIEINVDTGFDDVSVGAPFWADIVWMARHGLTTGCSATLYCPNAAVTREQMASFLVRALGLTAGGSPDAYTDIAGSVHRININRLAAAGITAGCTTTTFCPTRIVSRAQMASFLARALELVGPAPNAFTDDDGSVHEPDINRIAKAGITTGCTPTTYCPTAPVTRGQMAAFLHRAFADLVGE